jgi:ribokinase
MDIVTHVDRFPQPGETLHAHSTVFVPGGKGANQAVAVARSGAEVAMVGAVGNDAFGKALSQDLKSVGVNADAVTEVADVSTGVAVITVDSSGQNTILVAKGANDLFTLDEVASNTSVWNGCQLVLLQNEIHPLTNEAVLEWCATQQIPVVYNVAPAMSVSRETLAKVDTLVVNEHEATVISGQPVKDVESAKSALRILLEQGPQKVLLTLGEAGVLYLDKEGTELVLPAFSAKAVDTTAAGDTFIGAYATARVEQLPVESALQFASAAAALSVTQSGAQTSIPRRASIEEFLRQRS